MLLQRLNSGYLRVVAGCAWLLMSLSAQSDEGRWPADAFAQTTMEGAMDVLFGARHPIVNPGIEITAPDTAEDGAVVPVTVNSRLQHSEAIYIFVAKNVIPLLAVFYLDSRSEPKLSTRIKMAEDDDIVVVVKATGNYYVAHKRVEVAVGGCSGNADLAEWRKWPVSIKMRLRKEGKWTRLRALVNHPMENGRRIDPVTGATAAAFYIRELRVESNEITLLQAFLGPGIATNPYLNFKFNGAVVGETIRLHWIDNLEQSDEASVAVK